MDKLLSIYVDSPSWADPIKPDDFLITIGVNKSNSVYHVHEVRTTSRPNRINRHYCKVFRSDLINAIRREKQQQIHTLTWYKR